ncbi:MAG: GMC family oxidoreductase [Myxococcales bacterium]|nr:GMC family oxidoreductase [Myxococcales bacterium]
MIDVLVIGSGYGGSVVAARLAPTARVVVVERGRWWRPHEFPTGLAGLARAYRSRRNPGGLWSLHLGRGVGVATASAVGGSSAVNYGITAQPDDHAFAGWPVGATELAPWFARARAMLQPTASPRADRLGDKAFLDRLEPGRRVDLENTIDWAACTDCGDCVLGCRVGAKRGLERTYLAAALARGAELRHSVEALRLVPRAHGGFAVELQAIDTGARSWVTAGSVVLAAGTLGTLALLHRSGVPVGPRFGTGLSLNGDGVAFLKGTPHALAGDSGAPISTSVRIPVRGDDGEVRTLMVMSGRVPRAAQRLAAAALMVVGGGRRWRWLRDLVRVEAQGPMAHSFMYKLDAQDRAQGTARFTPRGVVIDWPDYADDPILRFAERRLGAWAAVAGGAPTPSLARLRGMPGLSVHPLGGCRMGRSIDDGVVDTVGQVFDPRGGVYAGLRIADGSIVPGSIGVPPSLTIAALAERIADDLRRGHRGQPAGPARASA